MKIIPYLPYCCWCYRNQTQSPRYHSKLSRTTCRHRSQYLRVFEAPGQARTRSRQEDEKIPGKNIKKNLNKEKQYTCGNLTYRSAHTRGHVPRTVHTKRFEEQVTGTCPKNWKQFKFLGLVAGTKLRSPRLLFVAKMASSHDGTCPRDLLQGLVPSCAPTFDKHWVTVRLFAFMIFNEHWVLDREDVWFTR